MFATVADRHYKNAMLATFLHPRIIDLACVGVIVCVGLAIATPRYRVGLDWADEGLLAYGAVRVMDGQVPNRDFVSLQPPLSFHVTAFVFKLLGTSLGSMRVLGMCLYLAMTIVIYAISRVFLRPGISLAAALVAAVLGIPTFNFVPFAVWQGITISLAAVLLLLMATRTEHRWLALLSGILTTISVGLRQDQGIYVAGAIFVLIMCLRISNDPWISAEPLKRVLLFWISGGTITAVVFCVRWWVQGALALMFQQLIVFPLTKYGKTSALPFPRFDPHARFPETALTFLFYFPPLIFCIALFWLLQHLFRRGFSGTATAMAFLLVWSGLFYCQVLTRSDLSHLLITLPPVFLLTAYCWHLFTRALLKGTIIKTLITVIVLTAVGCFLWTIHPFVLSNTNKPYELVDVARGGVRTDAGEQVTRFIRDVQQSVPADRSILVLPYQPMFYFLCDRRNPTHWNYLWPGDQSAADHEKLISEAKKDPPGLVLITGEEEFANYGKQILDYVQQEFRPAADVMRIRIYLPPE